MNTVQNRMEDWFAIEQKEKVTSENVFFPILPQTDPVIRVVIFFYKALYYVAAVESLDKFKVKAFFKWKSFRFEEKLI